jgi:hypothetical protein
VPRVALLLVSRYELVFQYSAALHIKSNFDIHPTIASACFYYLSLSLSAGSLVSPKQQVNGKRSSFQVVLTH